MIRMLLANKKLIGYAGAALAAAVTLYQLHDHVYDSGYNAAVTDIKTEQNKLLEEQRSVYEKKIQAALDTITADNAAELERIKANQKTEYVTQEVIKYVDREIKVPVGCESLANDVVSVLSKATGIIIGTASPAESEDTGRTKN